MSTTLLLPYHSRYLYFIRLRSSIIIIMFIIIIIIIVTTPSGLQAQSTIPTKEDTTAVALLYTEI